MNNITAFNALKETLAFEFIDKLAALPDFEAATLEAVSYTHLTLPTICSV